MSDGTKPIANRAAVARGCSIVHSNKRYANSTNTIGDVLLDLLHFAHAEGIDFDKELAVARRDFHEDTGTKPPGVYIGDKRINK